MSIYTPQEKGIFREGEFNLKVMLTVRLICANATTTSRRTHHFFPGLILPLRIFPPRVSNSLPSLTRELTDYQSKFVEKIKRLWMITLSHYMILMSFLSNNWQFVLHNVVYMARNARYKIRAFQTPPSSQEAQLTPPSSRLSKIWIIFLFD